MHPQRWQRIKGLFLEAVELDPVERHRFLAARCAGDTVVESEVWRLLEADGIDDSFIEPPLTADVSELLAMDTDEDLSGQRIGAYRIEKRLGSGGMGHVYLASRADGEFRKEVAVKIIRRGMDSVQLLRRFRQERQTLAGLDHPHIARLIDGGALPDGRPYLVMEYVAGEPIDAYCDRKALGLRPRLELFRTVCAAVHHAHQRLVVHRDIKPANILVTEEGQVKLLDFGIARLLGDPHDPAMGTAAGLTRRLMTPEFASPEQIRGEPVTTATDVYALGVLLYRLLTGRGPYEASTGARHSIERAILEDTPPRPSSVLARGDRGREVQRWVQDGALSGEGPVPRTPPSSRSVSWCRALVGDLDNIVLKALRKEPDRRYAGARAFDEDVERYLGGLPVQARRGTVRYRVGKFVRRHRVGVVATVAVALSMVLGLVGTIWQAHRASEQRDLTMIALTRAQEAEREAETEAERAHQAAAASGEVTDFLVDLFKVANPDESKGEVITARDLLDRGAGNLENRFEDQPLTRLTLLDALGAVYQNLAAYKKAGEYLAEACELSRDTYGSDSLATAVRLNNFAVLRQAQGRFHEAEDLHQEAYEIRFKQLPPDHIEVASSLSNLGSLYRAMGDFDRAERLLREALTIRRRVHGSSHPEVIASLNNLAGVLYAKGDYAAAAASLRDLIEVAQDLYGDENSDVAKFLNNLGLVLHMEGKLAEAEQYYTSSLRTRLTILGHDHPETAGSYNNLGGMCMDRKDFVGAEPYFREALAIFEKIHGRDHPNTLNALKNIGLALREQGRFDEAEPLISEALDRARRVYPEGHPALATILIEFGELCVQMGRLEEAETRIREGLGMWETALPPGHWLLADTQAALGRCLIAQRRFVEAEPLLLDGYERLKQARGPDSAEVRHALEDIIQLYVAWDRKDAAEPYQVLLNPPASTPAG